jgi:hypothetical protein
VVDLGDRVMLTPAGAEPVRERLEIRLEDRFKHQLQGSLDHAVPDGRYPELAQLAALLRDHHLPHRNRPELTRLQQAPDLLQEHPDPDPVLDTGHRDRINPGSPLPLVPGHAKPRLGQEFRVTYEVEQVTEPAGRILSRPAVQLGLHLPYLAHPRPLSRPVTLGAGIPRRVFGHYSSFPLPDTLPPFPVHAVFPRPEYYGGSVPPAPSAGIAPIRPRAPGWRTRTERTRAVPTFTADRSAGQAPGSIPAASSRLPRSVFAVTSHPRLMRPGQEFPPSAMKDEGAHRTPAHIRRI